MISLTIDAKEAVSIPLALRLPPELWLAILRLLDYTQLRKASRICKKIQKYTLGKEFDAALFRRGLTNRRAKNGDNPKVHPMLKSAQFVTQNWEGMTIYFAQDGKRHHPSEYPSTLNEYATTPASSKISLYLPNGISESVARKDGVRVVDVLKMAAEYWDSNEFEDLEDECLGDGWEDVRSIGRGHTVLTAFSSGSSS